MVAGRGAGGEGLGFADPSSLKPQDFSPSGRVTKLAISDLKSPFFLTD
jgi:hypothetical protein